MAYPLRHISMRVPWHDTSWDGRVCAHPHLNSSCLKLRRIAEARKDAAEQAVKGRAFSDLPEQQWPCCINERVSFLSSRVSLRHFACSGLQGCAFHGA